MRGPSAEGIPPSRRRSPEKVSYQPDTVPTSPSRPRSTPPRRRPPPRPDPAIRSRQVVALVVALVVILLLVLGVRSCRDSRRERALTDYAQDTGALTQESTQLSASLFGLLTRPGDRSPVEMQSTVNGLSVQASRLADRAGAVEAPDDLTDGHGQLAEVLALRRDGVAGVARQLPTALADEGRREAARTISGEMRAFLASDVLYARRFRPALERSFREEEIPGGAQAASTPFLPDISWLRPETVATRLGRLRSGVEDRAATPGDHGVALSGVTVTPAGTRLAPATPVQIAAAEGIGFDVEVQNQGESEEEMAVRLTLSGEGIEPLERDKELAEPLAAGESETVSIPLAETPPTGMPVTVEVEVAPVPGESEKGNNRGSFAVTFTPAAAGPDSQ